MPEEHHAELLLIIKEMKKLLDRIDRDIPLIQLAITASGEKMASTMTPGISPSRLMQASTLLSFADAQFAVDPNRPVQVGACFTLSLYMLFVGHAQPKDGSKGNAVYGIGEGERKPIWQEVMHKARVRICRTPVDWVFDPSLGYRPPTVPRTQLKKFDSKLAGLTELGHLGEYAYYLEIIEDLDDGRLHDDGPRPKPYDDMPLAGIRESIPIHQISKIFYTDTGRMLNIGSDDKANNPVLLLKRDIKAKSPIKLRREWFDDWESEGADGSRNVDEQEEVDRQLWCDTEHREELQSTYLPAHLDPEWLALEVYNEEEDDQTETADEDEGDAEDTRSEHLATPKRVSTTTIRSPRNKSTVDTKLLDQIRRIAIRPDPIQQPQELVSRSPSALHHRAVTGEIEIRKEPTAEQLPNVTRNPFFGSAQISSSLSLLEMLVRLTSLQEFQQTSHLAIPDHILTFFLEEASTTGLKGEAQWRARTEAKKRMGFDPYLDGEEQGGVGGEKEGDE